MNYSSGVFSLKKTFLPESKRKRVHWNEITTIYTTYSYRDYDPTVNKEEIAKNMHHIQRMRIKHSRHRLRVEELMLPVEMCHRFLTADMPEDEEEQLRSPRKPSVNKVDLNADFLARLLEEFLRSFGLPQETESLSLSRVPC
jgi:hypothetical protein